MAIRKIAKTYLVTGGAGFIGSHLVDRLIKDSDRVVVIDDFSNGSWDNLVQHKGNKKFIVYRKSICDDLSKIFRKHHFDAVFHLAALPRVQFSIAHPRETNETNINGTLNLLLAARDHGVKRFIFSSSSSVYGNQTNLPFIEAMEPSPISPYALQKLVGEHYCRLFNMLYGLEAISLRYFNVFGPRQNPEGAYSGHIPKFMKAYCLGGRPTINGDGEQTRDTTNVHDVVEANVRAMKTKNKAAFGLAFNVGAGKNYSVNEVTKKIVKLAGSLLWPHHGPAVIEPRNTRANTHLALKMLGWKPTTKLDIGLTEMWAYFSKKYKK